MTSSPPASPATRWPAEWEPHEATWLAWPHNPETWPGCLDGAVENFVSIVRALTLDGSGAQALTSHGETFNNLTISNAGTVTAQDALVVGSDLVVSGGTLAMAAQNLIGAGGNLQPALHAHLLVFIEVEPADHASDEGALFGMDLQIRPGERAHELHQSHALIAVESTEHRFLPWGFSSL